MVFRRPPKKRRIPWMPHSLGGGSVVISPNPANGVGAVIDPTVALGSISFTPTPAAGVGAVIEPTIIEGSILLTPTPAGALSSGVDPGVIYGDLAIVPSPSAGIGAVVDPSVILGDLLIAPDPAAAIGAKVDPTVDISSYPPITPSPAEAVSGGVDPAVILGSLAVTPGASGAIGGVLGPIVVITGGEAGDYVNVYTASLASVFSGSKGSLCAWLRVYDVGTWSDGNTRYVARFAADDNNQIYLQKTTNAGELKWGYVAGGTAITYALNGISELGWLHMAISWDKIQDEVKFYLDGLQVGTTQSGLGTWAGALASDKAVIGASDNTGADVWYGYLSHVALWKVALSEKQILWISRENMLPSVSLRGQAMTLFDDEDINRASIIAYMAVAIFSGIVSVLLYELARWLLK